MRPFALAASAAVVLSGSAQAHEVTCGDKAGALCHRWSRNFVGGPVDSGMPDRQGTVTLDLTIDPTGHVSACAVAQTSGNPALDRETCDQLMAYAHYRPALDDMGVPTEGSDTITIEWVFHPPEQDRTRSGPTT